MPIIDDKRFKKALFDILEDEADYKRTDPPGIGGLAGQQKLNKLNEWSVAVAKYYSQEIEQANTDLKNLRTASPARIQPALKVDQRRKLLGALGARLEYYAWQYHLALAPGNHNVKPNPTTPQINNLYTGGHANSMTRHAFRTIRTQFVNYITAIVNHVQADWNDIEGVFFPNWNLTELQQIISTGSDSHKEGKSVVILVFKGVEPPPPPLIIGGVAIRNIFTRRRTKELRLIYKPSDMTLDYYMVGDTQRVIAAGAGGLPAVTPGGSLLENINALIAGGHLVANAAFQPPALPAPRPNPVMPVYPILPRNSGNVQTAYGYVKFLKHRPKPEPVGDDIRFDVTLRNRDRPKWDWVTDDDDDLIDYYRLFGWYCAIGLNFGVADAHNQNLIAHRKKPFMIDLEISFKWICEDITKTGLHDVMSSPGPGKPGDKCHIFFKNGANLERTNGASAATYINAGISEAISLFVADPGNVLHTWLGSAALGNAIARYTPEATRNYGLALRAMYVGPNTIAPAPNPLPPAANPGAVAPFHADFRFSGRMQAWYNGNETEHRPNYAMSHPNHDWLDYLNCDYPVYYHQLGAQNLLDARGQAVAVTAPTHPLNGNLLAWNNPAINANQNRAIAGPQYFDHYPSIFQFEVDITTLPPPGNTFAHLNANVIADLTATFNANGINLGGGAQETTETADDEWRIIDPAAGPRIFHIRRVAATNVVKVYEAGTAIQMVQAQYNLLVNAAAFRNQLIADAHNYVNGVYPNLAPPPNSPALHDGF